MQRAGRLCAIAAATIATLGACRREVPSYGQALVVVDTNVAVPQIVDRLRVDIYGSDGAWLQSRDVALPDPADWPTSFGVYTPQSPGASTLVRLRAYPGLAVREYLGERFTPAPTSGRLGADVEEPDAAPGLEPRLIVDGGDVTPPTEPEPLTAIDRLVAIDLSYGSPTQTVPVVLDGECCGTMTDLAAQTNCVDQEGQRVAASSAPGAQAEPRVGGASLQGTFGQAAPCTGNARAAGTGEGGTPLFDDDVCVPGGAYLLGLEDPSSIVTLYDVDLATFPIRLAELPSLFVDRYEVTVGRWRDRVAKGFVPPDAVGTNDGPPPQDDLGNVAGFCSYSSMPLPGTESRETMALTCVSYASARAFCQFEGGDLLTEAEWEFAAGAAARPAKTVYDWGDDAPTCAGVVFGRTDNGSIGDNSCRLLGSPFGPAPVGTGMQDVTPVIGLHDMAGGVSEWVLDSARDYTSVCWMEQPIASPVCVDPSQTYHAIRGGAWDESFFLLEPSFRSVGDPPYNFDLGVRCKRAGSSP